LYWLSGWVLLVKEAEPSAYFVEGASSYIPINTVSLRNISHVC